MRRVFDPLEPEPAPASDSVGPDPVDCVRLLLTDHHRCQRHWQWDAESPAANSYRELVAALAVLRDERPAQHDFLLNAWRARPARTSFFYFGDEFSQYECRGLLVGFPGMRQRRIDKLLHWLAEQLSHPIHLRPGISAKSRTIRGSGTTSHTKPRRLQEGIHTRRMGRMPR